MRRISTFIKPQAGSSSNGKEKDVTGDDKSEVSTVLPEVLQPPKLKVKRVDYYYSWWARTWKYRNMASRISVEARRPTIQVGENDPWKEFAFVIIRTVPRRGDLGQEPTFKIVIKSDYLLKALKDVVQYWPGISWNANPLSLDPEMLLAFIPRFEEYARELEGKKPRSEEDTYVYQSVDLLLDSLRKDYSETLGTIDNLMTHGEISYDYLYSIFVPRSILIAECNVTGEPRAFQLHSYMRTCMNGRPMYQLTCESIDLTDAGVKDGSEIGKVQTIISIPWFKGTIKITELDAFPIQFHPREKELKKTLVERGKKWQSLCGIHHMRYDGVGVRRTAVGMIKHNIESRVMVDRATFRRLNAHYIFPTITPNSVPGLPNMNLNYSTASIQDPMPPPGSIPNSNGTWNPPPPPPLPMDPWLQAVPMQPLPGMPMNHFVGNQPVHRKTVIEEPVEMTEEEFMLTPPIVYGFSLDDKMWVEFNIEKLRDINWNEEAFENLVLPGGQKELLRSLVESHHNDMNFDDFVRGKGQGLVVNLFGPPGVGKTYSAEATSEHVRKPLYIVGAADLKQDALGLDEALERVFDVAQTWKAIVLIDEADVFLEKRSLHDMFRNAAVAVFLRHIEYYRGILFLTTNRVRVFDEAFLSRIHVALHLRDLTPEVKEQIWAAFLRKINATHITGEEIKQLAARDGINGRQIKNAARTACSLAVARKEPLGLCHLVETLDAMDEFMKDFEEINKQGQKSCHCE